MTKGADPRRPLTLHAHALAVPSRMGQEMRMWVCVESDEDWDSS